MMTKANTVKTCGHVKGHRKVDAKTQWSLNKPKQEVAERQLQPRIVYDVKLCSNQDKVAGIPCSHASLVEDGRTFLFTEAITIH